MQFVQSASSPDRPTAGTLRRHDQGLTAHVSSQIRYGLPETKFTLTHSILMLWPIGCRLCPAVAGLRRAKVRRCHDHAAQSGSPTGIPVTADQKDSAKDFPNLDPPKPYSPVGTPEEMNLNSLSDLSGFILRLSRKMDILAGCGDEFPQPPRRRIPEFHNHTMEPDFIVRKRRNSGSRSSTGSNGALPNVLAPSFRIHLSPRLLGSRRPGFDSRLLRDAA